ncbi:MAG: translation elongation factor Ts [Clostridiales Family XIII bacterium]|jgi:elongation factor Ts|nr:translation elongation factor Ts [Clostridiales Family XIII bacterium]
MAEVTSALIKELRERTGAGMMDCKNVLVEVAGDIDKAIDVLREKGLAKAAKKAGRIAAEGLIRINITPDNKHAGIIEVNSETDFVAKNQDFIDFVERLSDITLETEQSDLDAFLVKKYDDSQTVGEKVTNFVATIGENIGVRRFTHLNDPGTVYIGYLHGAGKIGVVVGLETEASAADVTQFGRDIAMQIASMNPLFIDESQVDPDYVEKEKEILMQQALNEGKPREIVEKMVVGRLKKELKETCLLEQKFVKNGELTVAQYLSDQIKALGKDIKVVSMIRYEVGEGIEKKEENFAEEVAKQIGN